MNSLTAKHCFYLLGAALLLSAVAATEDIELDHKKEKCKLVYSFPVLVLVLMLVLVLVLD
jgi:hypothetical protein